MLSAIDFQDEFATKAGKVDNVWPDRHLPFELMTSEPMGAKLIPKPLFCVRHFAAKDFG
jgi:hypothetical protein